tara:strand:+ start:347 stop:1207 length:861 start_codon:yes stop_codon:yes gene_type:complete
MFKKLLIFKVLFLQVIGINIFQVKKLHAFIPYYHLPTKKFLNLNGLEIGKKAYQLLYFGQLKEGLSLAKLAISLNPEDVNLWSLLAEAQINNKLFDDALLSIEKGKLINPIASELYFAESTIYINKNQNQKAKNSLKQGLEIQPKNANALFQYGNIFLMEKNYETALSKYDKIIKIKANFWQAINNKGLIYFEQNKIPLAIDNFTKAIEIKKNAESMLALGVSLKNTNMKKAILLVRESLQKNPNYVSYKYRKEQLWGEKLQKATEELFKIDELKRDISIANLYKN